VFINEVTRPQVFSNHPLLCISNNLYFYICDRHL